MTRAQAHEFDRLMVQFDDLAEAISASRRKVERVAARLSMTPQHRRDEPDYDAEAQ